MTDRGFVVWLTGLPSSGKTTIAKRLERYLRSRGFKVELLDGDDVRKWLSPEAGFSREDRERHLRRVAYVSKLLARNGVVVIASFVSPYRNVRDEARRMIEGEGLKFIEVYVKCSLEECMRRDSKGLYEKALRGEIRDMTGVQDVYEEPLNPEVLVDSEKQDPDKCVEEIVGKLREFNLI
ncbi:MAG: adenylyl-sulfate kinase [Candidatus Verstraetearchaeota archaeon]|jgi:adenylylsulfate kinase|nr:adenylyl-sulfate kinase [Candidatus Verstraetearchaeota archaeon]